MNEQHNFWASFGSMPFFSVMQSASVGKWTGVLQIIWNDNNLTNMFRGAELEKMNMKKAHVFLKEGMITNVLFSTEPSMEMINSQIALDNLLLLFRAFEGLGGMAKKNGMAFYNEVPEIATFPNVLNIDGKHLLGYTLLAEDRAQKAQLSH